MKFVKTHYTAYLLAGTRILIPRRKEEHISVASPG